MHRATIIARVSWDVWSPPGPAVCSRVKVPDEANPSVRSIGPKLANGSGRPTGPRPAFDPARVHPSWWARALQDESPSVCRAVVAAAPESIRGRVQSELLLDNDDLRAERPVDPQVLAWTLSLWTERLVGGEPDRPDDPPVIAAMSDLSLRDGYRLCRYAGEIKLALGGSQRAAWLREFADSAGPEFAAIAIEDIRATPAGKLSPRRLAARIGLLTIARLLSDCEPFRVRWALQHWPYTIAKLVRTLMPPAVKARRS